tara:strand:+ start:250 stop:522 length:273 start_codon:yes stop_codon:yes gene_type:complete
VCLNLKESILDMKSYRHPSINSLLWQYVDRQRRISDDLVTGSYLSKIYEKNEPLREALFVIEGQFYKEDDGGTTGDTGPVFGFEPFLWKE